MSQLSKLQRPKMPKNTFTRLFEQVVRQYLRFAIRKSRFVVGLVAVIAIFAISWLVIARPLHLDTDLASLLPKDLPCVTESSRISKRVGSIDLLVVAIQSPRPEDNIDFSNEILEKIKSLPDITWAANREDKSFFRDHRLLYLETEDLREIVSRVEKRAAYEKKISNPFYVSLEDEPPPGIDFSDILHRYKDRLERMGAHGLDEKPNDSSWINDGDYFASPKGDIVTVIARPGKQSTDINFAKYLVTRVEKLIEETNPHRNADMRVEVGGPYRNRFREFSNISSDIFSSTAVTITLITLTIIIYFRRLRAVGLVFIPLILSMVFTVGFTALTLEHLSITTALIFAVLLGLGIDFGVHLTVRYLDERALGIGLEESLSFAILNTGRAVLTAALTTAGAMAVLVFARFKGFAEFGIIATAGIIISYVVYILFLPALAAFFERFKPPRPWRRQTARYQSSSRSTPLRPVIPILALLLISFIFIWGAIAAFFIKFEYDFRKLRGQNISTSIRYNESLGHGSSSSVALPETAEASRALTRKLEQIIKQDREEKSTIEQVLSLFSFIPDNQQEKLKLLKELSKYTNQALGNTKIAPATHQRFEEIQKWCDADEVTIQSLPDWVKDKFREVDGTLGRILIIYPRTDEWNVESVSRFYRQFGTITVEGYGTVRVSSSGFIFVEVVNAAKRDGWILTIASLAMVFLLLYADFRSLSRAMFVFLPLLVGVSWTAAAMVILDIKLNLYNLLVVPTMLGIGIDASVHLNHSYMERGRGSLREVMKTTGGAVFISSLTTAFGFLGAMMTTHNGLRSIGILSIVGISIFTIATMTVVPLFLWLKESLNR